MNAAATSASAASASAASASATKPQIFVLASYMRDVSVAVDEFPKPGETRVGGDSLESSGGKGSNQAIQAARCGARVSLAGAVGRDAAGDTARALWSAEGIETSALQVRDVGSTGLALILVNAQGENQIVIAPGVNSSLTVQEIEAAAHRIGTAQLVVAQLEVPIDATLAGFRLARASRVPTLLNTAPASSAAAVPQSLWALTDVVVANELEAAMLAEMPADAEPKLMAARLLARVRTAVVITLGARGALLMLKTGQVLQTDAPRVDVVDSTGAGDAFVGAFAAAWAESIDSSGSGTPGAWGGGATEAPARRALLQGVAAGALACTRRGVVPSLAGRDAISLLAQRLEYDAPLTII